MASKLIIQLQKRNGSFKCETFDNLPSPKSVYITICFTDSKLSELRANELKTKLINSISSLDNRFVSSKPPCNGVAKPFGNCQALGIPDNLKLLIAVSDGSTESFPNDSVLSWEYLTLPISKKGEHIALPRPFKDLQIAFWNNQIDEVIPIIYGLIGVSDEDQRIFISYKRTDTSELAEQLFDRLNHDGFEVFLDRFSIQPGVNFQNRLYQELADKAMIVFLESSNLLDSEWVKLEISFAKKYRLGLLAVNVDSSNKIDSIDDEYRINVTLDTISKKINSGDLDNLVVQIKKYHAIALYRMRNYLNSNIVAAFQSKGVTGQLDKNGFISVKDRAASEHKIWATARPPKVNDYHYTDISHSSGNKVIFGPEFREQRREVINSWLSTKSQVAYYNEGQILDLVDSIYP